jgi:hypothetical protein
MPSGFPLTTEVNTVTNVSVFYYAWVRLHDNDTASLVFFDENVTVLAQGDDNIFETTPAYAQSYTCAWIAMCAREFGMEYTAPDKGPARDYQVPLTEAHILKRGFRYEPVLGRYVGPLELDVVLETCTWTRSSDYYGIGQENLDFTVRELSLHGKDVFDYWIPKLRAYASRYWKPISEDWLTVLAVVAH